MEGRKVVVVDDRRHKVRSKSWHAAIFLAGRKSNKCDSFNYSVVVSIKVAPDGVEGGADENSHSCKKEVMEHRCGSAKFGFGRKGHSD